jgi:hypothetical protein
MVAMMTAVAAPTAAGTLALTQVEGLPLTLTPVECSAFSGATSVEDQAVLELAVSGERLGEARALELEVVVFDEGGEACESHFTSCRSACSHCTSMNMTCSCNGGSINTTCSCGSCTQ